MYYAPQTSPIKGTIHDYLSSQYNQQIWFKFKDHDFHLAEAGGIETGGAPCDNLSLYHLSNIILL